MLVGARGQETLCADLDGPRASWGEGEGNGRGRCNLKGVPQGSLWSVHGGEGPGPGPRSAPVGWAGLQCMLGGRRQGQMGKKGTREPRSGKNPSARGFRHPAARDGQALGLAPTADRTAVGRCDLREPGRAWAGSAWRNGWGTGAWKQRRQGA